MLGGEIAELWSDIWRLKGAKQVREEGRIVPRYRTIDKGPENLSEMRKRYRKICFWISQEIEGAVRWFQNEQNTNDNEQREHASFPKERDIVNVVKKRLLGFDLLYF